MLHLRFTERHSMVVNFYEMFYALKRICEDRALANSTYHRKALYAYWAPPSIYRLALKKQKGTREMLTDRKQCFVSRYFYSGQISQHYWSTSHFK